MNEAYRLAGIAMPEEAWGISWKIWLPALAGEHAEEAHRMKQMHYQVLLDGGWAKPLPGADLARACAWMGHAVHFVTAASEASARAVLKSLQLPAQMLWGWELSPSARAKCLDDIGSMYPGASHFTYFDDREEGAEIATEAGWAFAHARWTQ